MTHRGALVIVQTDRPTYRWAGGDIPEETNLDQMLRANNLADVISIPAAKVVLGIDLLAEIANPTHTGVVKIDDNGGTLPAALTGTGLQLIGANATAATCNWILLRGLARLSSVLRWARQRPRHKSP
jgi:hypothetical protein